MFEAANIQQAMLESDPQAEANLLGPRRDVLGLYEAELERLHLDGFVYPATRCHLLTRRCRRRPSERRAAQRHRLGQHAGPAGDQHSRRVLSGWTAFGIEISARKWHDGDLIGWAYDYELHTRHRKLPVLVDRGLLPSAARPLEP